jgi:type VI secretion system protein ImpL
MDWSFGELIMLDLTWADQSLWYPTDLMIAPATHAPAQPASPPRVQPDLHASDRTASFASGGDWALLRMIDGHRPPPGTPPETDDKSVPLNFLINTVTAPARRTQQQTQLTSAWLTLRLQAMDPVSHALQTFALPHSAPFQVPQIKLPTNTNVGVSMNPRSHVAKGSA